MSRSTVFIILGALGIWLLPWPASAASRGRVPIAVPAVRVVYTGSDGNVYMIDATGGGRVRLATAGNGATYPWYAWSPDHKYVLLVRSGSDNKNDILVLNGDGSLRSTVATGTPLGSFYPMWATDSDVIAYDATETFGSGIGAAGATVKRVTLTGAKTALWSYKLEVGCGGGGPNEGPSLLYNQELRGYAAFALTWSVARHDAIYATSCLGTGIAYTDWKTGKTQAYPNAVNTVALAPVGAFVAVASTTGIKVYQGSATVLSVIGAFPTWSPDGRYLYFEQYRRNGTCALFKAEVARRDVSQVIGWQHAYSFGPLHVTPDGHTLIMSRIDATDSTHARISVQRLDLAGRQLTTIARNAARPAI